MKQNGFTMVELMIVMAIIGLLAALAIPSYMNFVRKAKASEATLQLAEVVKAEQIYFSEYDQFIGTNKNPASIPGSSASDWIQNDTTWNQLGHTVVDKVYFQYEVILGTPTYAYAYGDLDADGTNSVYQMDMSKNLTVLSPYE